MPKNILLLLVLTIILLTAYFTLAVNNSSTKLSKSEIEIAINQAKYLYSVKKEKGEDLSSGPCLSDALMPNWVLDIAHNPRLPIDDLPENQCPSFREGRSEHFVELDLAGNLIRAE